MNTKKKPENVLFTGYCGSPCWTLHFACGQLAFHAAQPLGGATRPLKTPTQRRFSRGFESFDRDGTKRKAPP